MKTFYKITTVVTSLLFLYLAFQMLFTAEAFVLGVGLQPSPTTTILAKRVAMFMLGITVLMFSSRNLQHSSARQVICLSTGLTLLGLSITGTYELARGTVNNSMLVAITIETILWVSFGIILIKHGNAKLNVKQNDSLH
jgi:hypothetical protein